MLVKLVSLLIPRDVMNGAHRVCTAWSTCEMVIVCLIDIERWPPSFTSSSHNYVQRELLRVLKILDMSTLCQHFRDCMLPAGSQMHEGKSHTLPLIRLTALPPSLSCFSPHSHLPAPSLIIGLTKSTEKAHICLAALEAVCFQSREVSPSRYKCK